MLVDIYPDGMRGAPVRLSATMVVIRQDDGTAIGVAGLYGGMGVLLSHAKSPDFNDTLRKLGLRERTECQELVLPGPPSGFQLIAAPP
jgi:hypothetical protein